MTESVKRKVGRPRKPLPGPYLGHNPGTVTHEHRANGGYDRPPLVTLTVAPITPRLLNLHATALYLTVSDWTVRDLEAAGTLSRVRIPLPNNGELRKILLDRFELVCLIENWKEKGS